MTTPASQPDRIIVILGPTAGGKSELAVTLAEQLHSNTSGGGGGEIINADSMQVYRHLNAGTAKPTQQLRNRVPHHLIDIVEPTQPWTVADWLAAAQQIIADIRGRGRMPIVVGGTNLYLKALLEGMFDSPPADETFRQSLADIPAPQLHQRLQQIDPIAAARIHPNDHKRIVRALEVHHVTGQPISAHQQQWSSGAFSPPTSDFPLPTYNHNPILLGLHWPTQILNPRINARVKLMFHPDDGSEDLVAETRRLLDANLLGPQAAEALGTKQVLAALAGQMSLDDALEQTKIETRRFAKNQRTWLKRYRNVHWLNAAELSPDDLAQYAANYVRAALSGSRRY